MATFKLPLQTILWKYVVPATTVSAGSYYYYQSKFNNMPTIKAYYDSSHPQAWEKITLEEVQKHSSQNSLWVTFKGSVYDLTQYANKHPGLQSRLLLAAGHDLEPYFNVYDLHFHNHIIESLNENFKIAELTEDDALKAKSFDIPDPYVHEPKRSSHLMVLQPKPFIGEPKLFLLTDNYFTPNHIHYVVNHNPVPLIDENDYEFTVTGNGINKIEYSFTLNDLKTKFDKVDVACTSQGVSYKTKDSDLDEVIERDRSLTMHPTFLSCAVSNAKWSGVRLRDVLKYCGLDVASINSGKHYKNVQYVSFIGHDTDETGINYASCIPINKAIDPLGDVILAYEMNDEPLPRDHGYPVRVLIPGYADSLSCKWLEDIRIDKEELPTLWPWNTYHGNAENNDTETSKNTDNRFVKDIPVQSIICNPCPHSTVGGLNLEEIDVKGVAWSGEGRGIQRVEVSIDGGETYREAELFKPIYQQTNREWAWTQFHVKIPLPENVKQKLKAQESVQMILTSKATDSEDNEQPPYPDLFYSNAKDVSANHVFHVPIVVDCGKQKGVYTIPKVPSHDTQLGKHYPSEFVIHNRI